MNLTRRAFAALTGAAVVAPMTAGAQQHAIYNAMWDLSFGTKDEYFAALDTLRAHGKPDLLAGLILQIRFTRSPERPIYELMQDITGASPGNTWHDWMLWQERHPEIIPHPSYADLKRDFYNRIDPDFADFLKPKFTQRNAMKIRLEEITWGGVIKDGIPSLDNPTLIAANEATYMNKSDLVFGVSINGDTRAYPLRIMGWHEMFNEVIGGVPVALAYCTLCGAGILFETKVKGRSKPLIFGSSGFLYRSNKLMFDRATHSLWNQFIGKPVVGPLVGSGIELQQRPVTIDTWANWKRANPDTRILSLQTGHSRNYGSGVVYKDYFASPDLMFPANVDQTQHKQKDYVFGVRTFGGAKAWPMKAFRHKKVINDTLAGRNVVVIGNAKTRTARAYERTDQVFSGSDKKLHDTSGNVWNITEDALVLGDQRLGRLPGHIAYWFAWDGYLGAESELFDG